MKILIIVCSLIAVWSVSLIIRGNLVGIIGLIVAIITILIAKNIDKLPAIFLRRTQARIDKSMIPVTQGNSEVDDEQPEEDEGVPFMDQRLTTRRQGPQFRRIGMNDKEADEAVTRGESYQDYVDVNEVTKSALNRDTEAMKNERIREIKQMMKDGTIDVATGRRMFRNIDANERKKTKKKPVQRTVYAPPQSSRHRDDFKLK